MRLSFLASSSIIQSVSRPVALTDRQACARQNPQDAQAQAMLASALHDAGRLDEAIASYEQAIRLFELASEPNGQLVGLTCHHAGVVLNKMRRYSEAKPLLERALTLYREVLPDRWPLNTLLNQVRRELKKCRVA